MTGGEQNAQFLVSSAWADLRRRGCLINFLYYFMARGIGLGAQARDLEGDGALPLLRRVPRPRLNMDRTRHDEGIATWGQDYASITEARRLVRDKDGNETSKSSKHSAPRRQWHVGGRAAVVRW